MLEMKSTPAPIVLFVYNRPQHTQLTLEKLTKNILASSSDLFIFSDGPRTEVDRDRVNEVRAIVSKVHGFARVTIVNRDHNMGLTQNIITGISDIINRYGTAIVVEDDIVTSPYFLDYMNDGLNTYQQNPSIFSISGYGPPIPIRATYTEPVYWAPRSPSWGWATWADRWDRVDWAASTFATFISNRRDRHAFNRGGNDLTDLLTQQVEGRINSWDICWCYAHYTNNAGCIYPIVSKVRNSGTDGSGTHYTSTSTKYDVVVDKLPPKSFPPTIDVDPIILRQFKAFYDVSIRDRLKRVIVRILRRYHVPYDKVLHRKKVKN